jgi:hypothetical protein
MPQQLPSLFIANFFVVTLRPADACQNAFYRSFFEGLIFKLQLTDYEAENSLEENLLILKLNLRSQGPSAPNKISKVKWLHGGLWKNDVPHLDTWVGGERQINIKITKIKWRHGGLEKHDVAHLGGGWFEISRIWLSILVWQMHRWSIL